MKAQTWLAVGLYTALTLTAAGIWLTLGSEPSPVPATAAPIATAADEPAPAPEPASPPAAQVPPYIAAIQEKYPHLSVEEIEAMHQADMYSRGKRRIFPRCQWGRVPEYDQNGKQVGESCLNSPHHAYGDETLAVLSYSDAEAARVLAMRLRHSDYDRALKLALRSIALSGGDAGILNSAARWRPVPNEGVNPDLARLSQTYVLESLRDLVEYGEYRRHSGYERRIHEMVEDPEATLYELDKLVYKLYDDIKQIEIDVTGRSSFGGDDDV